MGVLSRIPVAQRGVCMVKPKEVGLVKEISVALLLLEQPAEEERSACSCHVADMLWWVTESRIIITDRNCTQYVFRVLTSILQEMQRQSLLYVTGDGVTCSGLQGIILKTTAYGNARAAVLRKLGRT